MAVGNFDRALTLVLKHEGGYVNHPADPGGATNKGVTQATYNAYRKARGLASRSVKVITAGEVADIYRTRYWNAVKGDELPAGLDYAVFDFGVNSGPSRAIEFLQRVVGVDDDGQIGPLTVAAVKRSDIRATISALCDKRLAWLKTLPTWRTFGKGWSNRVVGVKDAALKMVGAKVLPMPVALDPLPQQLDDPGAEPIPEWPGNMPPPSGLPPMVSGSRVASIGAFIAVAGVAIFVLLKLFT